MELRHEQYQEIKPSLPVQRIRQTIESEGFESEMKWKDCSGGRRNLAGSPLAWTSGIGCFLLSGSWCLWSIRLDRVNKP